uniref:Uncharacterized protein n=1 Tax=Picea sitchensis TaxID=3332 RepID=A9NXE0_PICSI|nr:unknown [Picea sitchensis]
MQDGSSMQQDLRSCIFRFSHLQEAEYMRAEDLGNDSQAGPYQKQNWLECHKMFHVLGQMYIAFTDQLP